MNKNENKSPSIEDILGVFGDLSKGPAKWYQSLSYPDIPGSFQEQNFASYAKIPAGNFINLTRISLFFQSFTTHKPVYDVSFTSQTSSINKEDVENFVTATGGHFIHRRNDERYVSEFVSYDSGAIFFILNSFGLAAEVVTTDLELVTKVEEHFSKYNLSPTKHQYV